MSSNDNRGEFEKARGFEHETRQEGAQTESHTDAELEGRIRRAGKDEPADGLELHSDSLLQDGSTRYQPAMPESWWANTWQW